MVRVRVRTTVNISFGTTEVIVVAYDETTDKKFEGHFDFLVQNEAKFIKWLAIIFSTISAVEMLHDIIRLLNFALIYYLINAIPFHKKF